MRRRPPRIGRSLHHFVALLVIVGLVGDVHAEGGIYYRELLPEWFGRAPSPSWACPSGHAHVADKTDCHAFYHCRATAWGMLASVRKTCGDFLLFNPETNICDWPYRVHVIRPDCLNSNKKHEAPKEKRPGLSAMFHLAPSRPLTWKFMDRSSLLKKKTEAAEANEASEANDVRNSFVDGLVAAYVSKAAGNAHVVTPRKNNTAKAIPINSTSLSTEEMTTIDKNSSIKVIHSDVKSIFSGQAVKNSALVKDHGKETSINSHNEAMININSFISNSTNATNSSNVGVNEISTEVGRKPVNYLHSGQDLVSVKSNLTHANVNASSELNNTETASPVRPSLFRVESPGVGKFSLRSMRVFSPANFTRLFQLFRHEQNNRPAVDMDQRVKVTVLKP